MPAFKTFATFRAAETAAFAVLDNHPAPRLPEGALAFIVTAHPNANDDGVAFAPLFMIRYLDRLDRRAAEVARDTLLREEHRVVFGGEVFGPGDESEDDATDDEGDEDDDFDDDDGLSSRDREIGDRLDMGRNDAGEWLGFC